MDEIKSRFLSGLSVYAADFLRLAEMANVKIKKNIVSQIDNKVEKVRIIYDNGASQVSGYGIRQNTALAIGRVVRDVYMSLRAA